MNKTIFFILIGFLAVLMMASGLFYAFQFKSSAISNNPENWGVLGDYFGGILNPVISLMSLIVLIHISFITSKMEDKRWHKQLLHDSYSELVLKLDHLTIGNIHSEKLMDVRKSLMRFPYNINFLVEDSKQVSNMCLDLAKSLHNIVLISEKFVDVNSGEFNLILIRDKMLSNDYSGELARLAREISMEHDRYSRIQHQLLSYLKNSIVNKSNKKILNMDIEKLTKEEFDFNNETREFIIGLQQNRNR